MEISDTTNTHASDKDLTCRWRVSSKVGVLTAMYNVTMKVQDLESYNSQVWRISNWDKAEQRASIVLDERLDASEVAA